MTESGEHLWVDTLRKLAEKCPLLAAHCYWAGTSAIALEELHHRRSYDLDFHTRAPLKDVRPLLAELQRSFPGSIEVIQAPAGLAAGFRVLLRLPDQEAVAIEVLSNFDDVEENELVSSRLVPALKRVSLQKYLADKIQCAAERAEARDLIDIEAVLKARPDLTGLARKITADQDAVVLAERLLAWNRERLREDLAAYQDVRIEDALNARDRLLTWLREDAG